MKKPAARLVPVALLAALGACSGDGKGVTPPPEPVPGALTVSLTTPAADDRALVVSVTGLGAITDVQSASSAYTVHHRVSGITLRAAVFGPLASGPLLRFSVPDVGKAASYSATLVEVADGSNALRAESTGYTLTVAK